MSKANLNYERIIQLETRAGQIRDSLSFLQRQREFVQANEYCANFTAKIDERVLELCTELMHVEKELGIFEPEY